MTTITEFLTARLDEDEAVAKACGVGIRDTWHIIEWYDGQFEDGLTVSVDVHGIAGTPITSRGALLRMDGEHIARHDPARVLADVAAKRRLVKLHTTGIIRTYKCSNRDHIQDWQCERAGEPYTESRYCEVCSNDGCAELPLLAMTYAEHSDYDQAWTCS